MSTSEKSTLERYYPPTRADWRGWLAANHATSPGVWVIYYKKGSGMPTVSYDEAVEEALCFGWIDSLPNKLDEISYLQLFTPRKAGSPWSRLNKARVETLIQQGLMTPAGMDKIDMARIDGSWTVYDLAEDLIEPEELRAGLDANPLARANWDTFSPSVRKGILWYIYSAKRPETRLKRVEETVSQAAIGKRAQFDR